MACTFTYLISERMKIAFFSTLPFEKGWFEQFRGQHQITYIPEVLSLDSAALATGHQAVCAFVNDDLGRPVLLALKGLGIRVVGMRCVGLDNVDQPAMAELNMTLLHVPGYSPYAVAEQAVTLILGFVRHLTEAHDRVREGNFAIDGLMGRDLHGKTVGVVGTGHIGKVFIRIMQGFGCHMLAYDICPDHQLLATDVNYMPLDDLFSRSDIVALHCPLSPQTRHLINAQTLALMEPGTLLINTSRGGLVDTEAVLDALDSGQLAGYAADVYEDERAYFHYDFSAHPITDNRLNRLRQHPHVLLTAHQGFLTEEALKQLAKSLIRQFSYYDNQQTALITKASMC